MTNKVMMQFIVNQNQSMKQRTLVSYSNDIAAAGSIWWYFDTASNSYAIGDRAYFVSFTEETIRTRSIRGVSPRIASRIAGVGTVALVTEVDGEQSIMYVDDML
ncbi:hypothetical protein PC129_g15465 [Phytophthora cactorum]|uniref:Uncharacterized protein n=1 Tax=Phytophthora cactorum TaxID=29920 RepID=A0A329S3F8_9STRA|nr:hypothetical protein Pcac1_g25116 [Phytophthora cactorum]KAG2810117.1 hypothetical protein PC111_g15786 [Phytophthora cactorum]KAG2827119.1 hypothetical protein PC112_g8973 [Phytophthora cactorum]KAG2850130.1 hypothetical protein PC113_g17059 [Phytophthora cactorum]KAG2888063.1 hypothetical protein PC114_g18547 [Phytophthora cactorum]